MAMRAPYWGSRHSRLGRVRGTYVLLAPAAWTDGSAASGCGDYRTRPLSGDTGMRYARNVRCLAEIILSPMRRKASEMEIQGALPLAGRPSLPSARHLPTVALVVGR